MQVLRDGKQITASPSPIPAAPTFDNLSDLINPKTDLIPPLGIFVIDLNHPLVEAMGTRAQSGVIVAGLLSGEPATLTDLTVGDVITTLNGKPVKSKQELLQDLNAFKTGDAIALEVERRGVTQYVAFEME
jgi:S1-C subfamily serine protease